MDDELVHLTRAGGIATITLDSPANRNALSRALVRQLREHVETSLNDPAVRVVVLTATGTVFCSGADLAERRVLNTSGGESEFGALIETWLRMVESDKPFVCRLNGHARAGGIGLAAACDISIATEAATFAFTEVRIGVAPAMISALTLPRLGPVRSSELMLTGRTFTASEAAQYGLITASVPADQLDAAVDATVAQLLLGAPTAMAATKRLMREVPGQPLADALRDMEALSTRLFVSEDALEGFTAFAEKRPPRWAAS